MRVDLRRLHVLVLEQFLDHPDIVTVGQHVGGETVPKGVRSNMLVNLRALDGSFQRLGENALVQMVPS